MKKKDKHRFVKIYEKSKMLETDSVFVDRVTGVNYLFHNGGYPGGLTVLVDRDGKPLVTSEAELMSILGE
jgi:hypothetical protein